MSVKIIFGDARNMKELDSESVQLVVTSPPYYNAPFDFPGLFRDYDEYLKIIEDVGRELYRVLEKGRIACFVIQDVRIDGELYPIVADIIKVMRNVGFRYRDKIIWKKPEGYIRISRRSGVMIQHPYPMYFYPDNIYEEIIIFQKGKFDYNRVENSVKEQSKIDLNRFQREKWYLSVWEITNVLPSNKISKYTAAFPEELVERLITLYSYVGDTVLDPFLGTGTTAVVARRLNRNCVGYEIDLELKPIIEERLAIKTLQDFNKKDVEIIVRDDAKRLRTQLRKSIEKS
ncbi:MAG: site-specific DNA-methyltransferase [Candidatus Methanosuratincola petrocarbonis]